MQNDRTLEVNNLKVSFNLGDKVTLNAVKDVSFHIDKGETLALVGESGSGKSVTAMTIMRLTDYDDAKIDGGSIQLRLHNGNVVDLAKMHLPQMTNIRGADVSIIFQDPMSSLNPVFTVGHQISEAIIQHQGKSVKQAGEIALASLNLVRVPDAQRRMQQYPHQLSGGMRQRVMIAMALCCRPSLLIADEPTTALDVTIQAQILDLIRTVQDEIGMSVLFITHDMAVVAEIADRVCVMQHGEIVETGSVFDVFENPVHPYTRALISAVPILGSMTGRAMPEKFPVLEVEEFPSFLGTQ
ncbi:MAG: ABC transporter ATP-binding protein [Planktomarina sp.]|nr:ABC transporter ATP-binding protein [Planktomarina sp.]